MGGRQIAGPNTTYSSTATIAAAAIVSNTIFGTVCCMQITKRNQSFWFRYGSEIGCKMRSTHRTIGAGKVWEQVAGTAVVCALMTRASEPGLLTESEKMK